MSIVYAIQRQQRWSEQKQELVDAFDLSSSIKYGELRFLLSPKASPFNPESVLRELRVKLDQYKTEDYLLLVGNPVLIGFAVALAARATQGGQVNVLQWSGRHQEYIPISALLYQDV